MMVLWKDLNGRHITTPHCAKGAERKQRWLAAEEIRERETRTLKTYTSPQETVTPFKYLGRVLTDLDGDWPAVVGNIWNSWKSLARLLRILGRGGASTLGCQGCYLRRWCS